MRRSCASKAQFSDTVQDGRVIFKTIRWIRTIGCDRPRFSNGYWTYFFDFIPIPPSSGGGVAGLIRKLHSFLADVHPLDYCSQYNLTGLLPSATLYAFIFPLNDPAFFRSTSSMLWQPLIFQSSTVDTFLFF